MRTGKWPLFVIGIALLVFVIVIAQRMMDMAMEGNGIAASSEELVAEIVDLTPDGWYLAEPAIRFTPNNAYEQLNGQAEYYLSYEMKSMIFASFENSAETDMFIDLYIFDMGTPTLAFGAYSGERSGAADAVYLGREAYRAGTQHYVWKGSYYIKVLSSVRTGETQAIVEEIAKETAGMLNDSGESVWGLTALPEKDRKVGTEQYFHVNAMGLDFLSQTYMAQYDKYGTSVDVFLSQKESPEAAGQVTAGFQIYTMNYGRGVSRSAVDDVNLIICDMGDGFDVVFRKDNLVGGVFGVADRDLAVQSATDLLAQL